MCQHRFQANSIRKMDADQNESSSMEIEEPSINNRVVKSASMPGRARKFSLSRRRTMAATYRKNTKLASLASFTKDDKFVISTVSSHSLWLPSGSRQSMTTQDPTILHFHQTRHHDDYASEPENRINTIRFYVRRIVQHILFRLFTVVLIFVDIFIVLLSFIHNDHKKVYDDINSVFVCIFMCMESTTVFGIGWKYYKDSWISLIDLFIITVCFVFISILLCFATFGPNDMFAKLTVIGRFIRLLRILRILRLYVEDKVIAKAARKCVSHNKRRYQKDGFDLDLCYITERVIAMSIPSTGIMACYRNPVREVARFLDTKHKDHYRVYNLCSEKTYDENYFNGPVQRVSIDDHNVPKFDDIIKFANDVTRWMDADDRNVIAVHCKGGKGRTGMMICVWLVHSSEFTEAQASLNYFGNRRTDHRFGEQYQGVQTPSQSRYVGYFDLVRNAYYGRMPPAKRLLLSRMNIVQVSGIGTGDGKDLRCRLNVEGHKFDINFGTHLNCKTAFDPIRSSLIVKVFNSPILMNDVKVMFFCSSRVPRGYENCAFYCWFHTGFIEENRLWLPREQLDNPHKPRTWRTYLEGFGVDFYFNEIRDKKVVIPIDPVLGGMTIARATH